jgi:pyruvate/2-oxoglutarate/acetoin dehydrogenase E1 component
MTTVAQPNAELASVIATGGFYSLDTPVKRMGAMNVPIPFSPPFGRRDRAGEADRV